LWVNYAKSICPNIDSFPKFVPIIIALNKYDLIKREFGQRELEKYLNKIYERENIYICSKISAKDDNGINLFFEKILEIILPKISISRFSKLSDNKNYLSQSDLINSTNIIENNNIHSFTNKSLKLDIFDKEENFNYNLKVEDFLKSNFNENLRKNSNFSDDLNIKNLKNGDGKNDYEIYLNDCSLKDNIFNSENKYYTSFFSDQSNFNNLMISASNENNTTNINSTLFHNNYISNINEKDNISYLKRITAYSKKSDKINENIIETSSKNNKENDQINSDIIIIEDKNKNNQKLVINKKNKKNIKDRKEEKNKLFNNDNNRNILKKKIIPKIKYSTKFEKFIYNQNGFSNDKNQSNKILNKSFVIRENEGNESRNFCKRSVCCQ